MYEVTRTEGATYVRYLVRNVRARSPQLGLTVATYVMRDAFAVTLGLARSEGSVVVARGGGRVAFFSRSRATSVYLAGRGEDVQVEVFHPVARFARELVARGRVSPVR